MIKKWGRTMKKMEKIFQKIWKNILCSDIFLIKLETV